MAVNAAAQTKNASRATKIQVIPVIFLRRLRGRTAPDAATTCGCELSKRTVSLYSARPSPRRNPQFRQNRNSEGIGEWQLAQVVTVGAATVSEFCNISNPAI